ncbi:MAG TPA: HAMP domain-containing sensor histidine kinase [Bryobacteraceae bacterium]|nr:HAMP domain-containing sensor histidine kinase [Bryobacteraceae bacterium]
MGRSFGFRTLLTICGGLAVLLAALAVVQYRWSTRVAAADAQREKEHLDSAASLFANEFDGVVGQAVEFLQNEARPALQSNTRITALPKLIAQLFYLDTTKHGERKVKRLMPDGMFAPAGMPPWMESRGCAAMGIERPPAVVISVYDEVTSENRGAAGVHIFKAFSRRTDRCFVAVIDQSYLRNALLPQLIQDSFRETTAQQYDFTVVSRASPHDIFYGKPVRADVQKAFFSIPPLPAQPRPLAATSDRPPKNGIFVERLQVPDHGRLPDFPELFGPGIWQLEIAHKGLPLAAAFERTRQRDLLSGLAVELLLVAGIVFLMIGARRMQRLADQKMQFVAGVSHELRTPVSAIAMLSRNQADGLVTGADKVKQYGELINQQSRRLNDMVEQALQYAGIHSGLRRPARNEIDLGRLIQEAVEARSEELARNGFAVEMALSADLPPVVGDTSLLRTAFDNLLSNALKHAHGGHWIQVGAQHDVSEKEVRISVEDRGAGIDAEDQAEIFEPFSRGRAAVQAQIPGSGLGLSLVRNAAEAHRGSVTLVSEPGRGSKFTLHLPL